MAKRPTTLEWCIVRLGNDHNWWVEEVSDPVRWDVDGLTVIDPRQLNHIIELLDQLRDYGFDPELFERAFLAFRVEKDLGQGRVRIVRTRELLLESEEKLFALPDVLDEEHGPYADLLDHATRVRVKMLNDAFDFEQKLTVDEVEDQIREEQNNRFIEGKAVHVFDELNAILDYVPEGWDIEEGGEAKPAAEETDGIPDIEVEEDEALKNDASLKWDEDEDDEEVDEDGNPKPPKAEGEDDDEDGDEDDEAEKSPRTKGKSDE
jgi:hypothetical protein